MTGNAVPTIFSPRRRGFRDARARTAQARAADPADWLLQAMAADIAERVAFMRLAPRRVLILSSGAVELDGLTEMLPPECACDHAADLAPDVVAPESYDLVVDLARLDTVNDLPGRLLLARLALTDAGVFLATFPAAGSLPMLRRIMLAADGARAAPRIHPQIDNRAATMLMERAGFARQVVDGYGLDARYGTLARLVADLREQGLGSALAHPAPALGKAALARAERAFAELAGADGKLVEHFELLTLTGWKT